MCIYIYIYVCIYIYIYVCGHFEYLEHPALHYFAFLRASHRRYMNTSIIYIYIYIHTHEFDALLDS